MWEFKYQDGDEWTSVRLTDVEKKEDFMECMPAIFDDMREWVNDMKESKYARRKERKERIHG